MAKEAQKAIAIGIFLAIVIQCSGCVAIVNYTTIIFQETGSNLSAIMSSVVVCSIQVLGFLFAANLVERCGRKVRKCLQKNHMNFSIYSNIFIPDIIFDINIWKCIGFYHTWNLHEIKSSRIWCEWIQMGSSRKFFIRFVHCIISHAFFTLRYYAGNHASTSESIRCFNVHVDVMVFRFYRFKAVAARNGNARDARSRFYLFSRLYTRSTVRYLLFARNARQKLWRDHGIVSINFKTHSI